MTTVKKKTKPATKNAVTPKRDNRERDAEILRRLAAGEHPNAIAATYKIHPSRVWQIKRAAAKAAGQARGIAEAVRVATVNKRPSAPARAAPAHVNGVAKIAIEKGIPIPALRRTVGSQFPWDQMKMLDSFVVASPSQVKSARQAAYKREIKVASRKLPDGRFRLWKLPKGRGA